MKFPSTLLQKSVIAILIILLPVVVSFVFDYYKNKENLKEGILREMTVIAEGVEGQVYNFLEMSRRRAYDFSTDGYIRDSLLKIKKGDKDARFALNRHLLLYKKPVDETLSRINIISTDGKIVAATDFSSMGLDVSNEEYFIKGREGLNISENFHVSNGLPELAVTAPIKSNINNGTIGILVNFITLSELNDVLSGELSRKFGAISSTLGRHKTMEIYLANKDRYMITESRFIKDAVLKQKVNSLPIELCLNSNKEFTGFYKDYRGIEVAGASMCVPKLKWVLLIETDTSETFAPLSIMRKSAITSGGVVVSIILMVLLYIFKKFVIPLRKVYTAAEDIAQGNYDIRIPVVTSDEIGIVSSSINRMARDIKERTKLLEENEGQIRVIIDNSTAVIYLKDREGRYILINKRYEELFHITKEYIKGKTDFDIFPEDIASAFKANDVEVLNVKQPLQFEEIAPHDDGLHYYLSIKVPIFDSYGFPYGTCGISTDITERKLMENEINLLKNISISIGKSEDFDSALREVLARVCEFTGWVFGEVWFPNQEGTLLEYGSICYGKDNRLKSFCDASKQYTFSKGTGLPGRVWLTNKPEWIRDVTINNTGFLRPDLALKAGIKASLGVPIIAGEDVLAVIVFFVSNVREEDRQLISIIWAVASQLGPIFQRKHTEDLRSELQQRYEGLVNSLDVGVYRHTLDGRFTEVNQGAIRLAEAESEDELLIHNAEELVYNKKTYAELIEKLSQKGFIKNLEVECITLKGRRFWASISAVLKKDENGITFIDGLIEDITLNKSLEEQLIQAQKTEAIGRLAGGIAHDFNNILTAIIGYGTILRMKRGDDELLNKNISNILTLCERAANLTQGLLTFSRRQYMNVGIYNLNEIVKSSEKMLSRIIGEDITINSILHEKELMVKADFAQIEQVLLNLATNSIDAMPAGGTLTIRTSLTALDDKYIEKHGYGESGDYASILFSDTGTGVSEDVMQKMFDPFYTTKEVGKGTGLGLSIVSGIVKQHNGFIDVNSVPGTGTTFSIYIPITKLLTEKKGFSEVMIQKGKKMLILLAEDEEEVRKVTANALREFGYTVIEAVDGEDALIKFMENKDSIHLLFFDIVMPHKGGLDAYEEIIKSRPELKAIFTSGYTLEMDNMNKIHEYGCDFIPKPISPTLLYKKVSDALNSITSQIKE
ncbi:MAG: PAS domain-containing protein [Nitrospirae bacterium]|nr:PAS domain-containing protein [Nitrospirota bacterium]